VAERLFELASEGRRAWPKIAWPIAEFAAELERRGLVDLPPERIPDVYLAWATAHGDAAALAAFDERYGNDLVTFASKVRLPGALIDEVVQDVRSALLVGRGGLPARIGQFAGRGELRSWLQVTTVRQAVLAAKQLRARRELPDTGPLEALAAPALDIEGELTRARCRDEFRAAFAEALAALTPRERAVLRSRYLDGLTEDEVARVYDVHRVTVARWTARALARVLRETRRGLARRLTLATDDVASVIRVLRSQLPVTLQRTFGRDEM
jgi:RNA polymerase sigma-70 factor (ECF subfamily)